MNGRKRIASILIVLISLLIICLVACSKNEPLEALIRSVDGDYQASILSKEITCDVPKGTIYIEMKSIKSLIFSPNGQLDISRWEMGGMQSCTQNKKTTIMSIVNGKKEALDLSKIRAINFRKTEKP